MATKVMNFKMEEEEIRAMKEVAGVFHLSVTDLIKNAIRAYMEEAKKDPFYRLTANVRDASAEETEEVLASIENLTDEDLSVVSTKRFIV